MRTRSPACVVVIGLDRRAEVGHVEAAAQAVGQRRVAGSRRRGSGPAGGCRRRPGCSAGRRSTRPSPSAPRRKSMSRSAQLVCGSGCRRTRARLAARSRGAAAARRGRVVEHQRPAPCPRSGRGSSPACFRFSTRRVRSPAWATLTERRLPWLISTGELPSALRHARQVDRDARRRLDREAGRHRRQRLAQLDADHLRRRPAASC